MITLKHYANEAIDIQSINDKLLSQLIEQKPAYLKKYTDNEIKLFIQNNVLTLSILCYLICLSYRYYSLFSFILCYKGERKKINESMIEEYYFYLY